MRLDSPEDPTSHRKDSGNVECDAAEQTAAHGFLDSDLVVILMCPNANHPKHPCLLLTQEGYTIFTPALCVLFPLA